MLFGMTFFEQAMMTLICMAAVLIYLAKRPLFSNPTVQKGAVELFLNRFMK